MAVLIISQGGTGDTYPLPYATGVTEFTFKDLLLTEEKPIIKVNNKAKKLIRKQGYVKKIQQRPMLAIRTRSAI